MSGVIYASDCCGVAVVPGHGPDNIEEAHGDGTRDARRRNYNHDRSKSIAAECPVCGAADPALYQVRGFDE